MPICMQRAVRALWLTLAFLPVSAALAVPLQGSEWKPLRIADQAVPEDSVASVQFRSKGRLSGHTGCNRLFASYQASSDGRLSIGRVATTRMACAPSVMARESTLAAALENAHSYRRDGTSLVLFDDAGQPILELRQTDWD